MRNTKSAFTLVELIVVITILAILGTIAFISLQGYSAEARNGKRIQDLSSISSSLNIKLTRGMDVMAAIANTNNAVTGISLAGVSPAAGEYQAGSVNYTALEMKASEFSDPFDDAYSIGATTLAGGPFELAASIEQDGGEVAKLSGNFNSRTIAQATVTGSLNPTNDKVLVINLADTGKLKVGDTTTSWKILKISSDGTSITYGTTTTTDEALANAESPSLVGAGLGLTNVGTGLVDGESNLPY